MHPEWHALQPVFRLIASLLPCRSAGKKFHYENEEYTIEETSESRSAPELEPLFCKFALAFHTSQAPFYGVSCRVSNAAKLSISMLATQDCLHCHNIISDVRTSIKSGQLV